VAAAATAAPTAVPVPTATPNTQPVAGSYIHIAVRLGENLVTYTYRYGIRGDALRAANPQIKDAAIIYPGDVLTIPVVASFTPSRTTPFFYVLQTGDTLTTVGANLR